MNMLWFIFYMFDLLVLVIQKSGEGLAQFCKIFNCVILFKLFFSMYKLYFFQFYECLLLVSIFGKFSVKFLCIEFTTSIDDAKFLRLIT